VTSTLSSFAAIIIIIITEDTSKARVMEPATKNDGDVPTANKAREMTDKEVAGVLLRAAKKSGLDVAGGTIRRSSSRFCISVEHGDYNGTELFGLGANRFIWLAYKPNGTDSVRLLSANYPCPVSKNGIVMFKVGNVPTPGSSEHARYSHSWARFPFGADWVLRQKGYKVTNGFDCVLFSNIPGGGMSRSASLSINLVLTTLEINGIPEPSGTSRYEIVELAQKIENDYIGSPCGNLDQVMILYAKAGFGTHFIPSKGGVGEPRGGTVKYVPLGGGLSADDFRIVALDTGTDRPGLEKSTYAVRARECKEFASMLAADASVTKLRGGKPVRFLADVDSAELFDAVLNKYDDTHSNLCDRLRYIYEANCRFKRMLSAWRDGRIADVGAVFRADGHGLRDKYKISGPELEAMCDIARTCEGCLGERMLGGGDKGASGAITKSGCEDALRIAVNTAYPRSFPHLKDKFKVHICKMAQGIKVIDGLL